MYTRPAEVWLADLDWQHERADKQALIFALELHPEQKRTE